MASRLDVLLLQEDADYQQWVTVRRQQEQQVAKRMADALRRQTAASEDLAFFADLQTTFHNANISLFQDVDEFGMLSCSCCLVFWLQYLTLSQCLYHRCTEKKLEQALASAWFGCQLCCRCD